MIITSKYPQLSIDIITEWENKNIPIPLPYKTFLLKNNGGGTGDKNTFKVPKMRGEFGFHEFFGIHEGLEGLDYIQTTYTNRKRFPAHYFAIASDVAGNLILMGQNEKKSGQIFFWYHEGEVSENEDDLLTLFGEENIQKQLALIDSGWDVNEKLDISSQTALERVAQFGNDITVLEALLHKGANMGKVMEQVLWNRTDSAVIFAKILLDAGADPDYSDEKAKEDKNTLLGSAVNQPMPQIEIAKLLIRYGADVAVEDDYGWTALRIAQRTLENGVPEMQEVIDLIKEKL